MDRIILQRLETSDEGTFGVIEMPDDLGGKVFHTGELPWRHNRAGTSCIPAGVYRVSMQRSPRFRRDLYELQDVPGRSDILIHKGNWCGDVELGYASNVEGCILLGRARGVLRTKDGREQQAVIASDPAVTEFERLLGGAPFEIEIRDVKEN